MTKKNRTTEEGSIRSEEKRSEKFGNELQKKQAEIYGKPIKPPPLFLETDEFTSRPLFEYEDL